MRRFGLLAALMAARQARQGGPVPDLPPGAGLERDLAYGDDPAQRLDIYSPASPLPTAPWVLFVHGGGWRRGDKAMPRMVGNKAPHWLRKGCHFVSANYRMLPAAGVLEQADDLARALAWLQRRAGDAGVVLVGHSAGAHLAALLTADPTLAQRHGLRPWRATVALDSAALDMVAVMSRPHFPLYDPVFGDDPAFWRQASPLHRLQQRPAVPLLLLASSLRADALPPARAFAARVQELGGRAEVAAVALDHFEINDQLGAPGPCTEAVDGFLRSVGVP